MRSDYDGIPVPHRDTHGLPYVPWEIVLRDQHHLGAGDRETKALREELELARALAGRNGWYLKWADSEGFWTHEPTGRWVTYGGGIRAKNAKRFQLWEDDRLEVDREPRAFATIAELIEAAETTRAEKTVLR